MRKSPLILVSVLAILVTISSCMKADSQKVISKWKGKWEIIKVDAISNDYSETNPFGTIEFFENGDGIMKVKNLNYSNEDQGIEMGFVVYPQTGVHLKLYNLFVTNTNPGFESLIGKFPCDGAEITFLWNRGFFGTKKTATMEMATWPDCSFVDAGGGTWTIRKVD